MGCVSADPFIHHMAVPIKQLQSSADDKISLIVYLGQMQLCGKICHGDGLHLGGVLYNEGHVIQPSGAAASCSVYSAPMGRPYSVWGVFSVTHWAATLPSLSSSCRVAPGTKFP